MLHPALSLMNCGIHFPHTLLLISIHTFSKGVACLLACQKPGVMERIPATSMRYMNRSIPSSVDMSTKSMGLRFFKVRKEILIAPSICSFPLPSVVVLSMSLHIHNGIQGKWPTPNSSSWPIHATVIGMNLGESGVVPVVPKKVLQDGISFWVCLESYYLLGFQPIFTVTWTLKPVLFRLNNCICVFTWDVKLFHYTHTHTHIHTHTHA